jgi:predicted nucleotidyltransferase
MPHILLPPFPCFYIQRKSPQVARYSQPSVTNLYAFEGKLIIPNMGAIILIMGTTRSKTSEVLFTKTQRRVLGLLFGDPDRSYYANEIVRFAGAGTGAVLRELARLSAVHLVTVKKVGNQKHYQANHDAPIFDELRLIAQKTLVNTRGAMSSESSANGSRLPPKARTMNHRRAGLRIPQEKLARLCRRFHIRKLTLFGSAARGEMKSGSDVDLMVEFEPDRAPSLWDSPKLDEEFSALFGNRPVDIVPPEVLRNPYRRKTIQRDLKVLYEAK